VRVATFNVHAGVDGWGRPTSALDHAATLGADVLVCPELWRALDGADLYRELADRLGMEGRFAPLARGERITNGSGGRSWQPLLAHLTGERGLYFSEHRSLTTFQRAERARREGAEAGEWGLGLLTSLAIEEIRVIALGRLWREKVSRAVIVARLRDGEHSFYVVAVHGAHITHGSYFLYRRISAIVDSLDPGVAVLLVGDFNCWRPLLRLFLPRWRSMVRARTWPSRHPHSQIDHILGRGPWQRLGGGASEGGSDHRALYADLELRGRPIS
jgi:endonuclease/exonuclease/phosphatase family metal-dependent hydrolase